ncbi:MAG: Lrp/AsnC family transcriptional regulator [Amphritea sp.]|nr:Lrp/AsnC family transcriptional regulator [Amphritea sp.]
MPNTSSLAHLPADLDNYDRHILRILQQDGRISNQQLADEVGLSTAASWRRVKALEERGILQSYKAQVDPQKLNYGLCVFLLVSLLRHSKDSAKAFEEAVKVCPEVLQCYAVTGNADFVLRVIIPDMATYDHFLTEKIFSLPGVSQVKSNFTLREIKYETAIPV